MYTEDIKEKIDRFIINHQLYADDSQLLAHMKINAVMEHHGRPETCVESLRDWCFSLRLQLNPDKTELIRFGSRANLVKIRQLDVMSLNLCSVAVEPVDSIRDLGVILDSEFSMRVHLSKISSTCFFHLRRLRKLRPLIDTASSQRLASAFILSRVDYCNSVLVGIPTSTLAPLQRVLNAAARFLAGATSRTHVSGIMKSLQWLTVAYRIRFKPCVRMHGVHNGTSPYLTNSTTPISSLPGYRQLRSAMTTEYDIPHTRTKFGDRAFSVAGPREWSALLANIENITDLSSFKRAIKTQFFCIGIFGLNSFPDCTMFGASGQFLGGVR